VTIDGKPASVDASNNFTGTAQLAAGTTTVTVKAKDASGNETTQQYEVDTSGSTSSYTYDANGNLTADGTKTYYWNALNQLVEVKEGSTTVATFEYDGFGRRTEKVAAGVTRAFVYDGQDIVEERISGTSSDTIRYYHGAAIDEPLARKNSADDVTYYLADHLGSIVQETNASGAVTLEREYDPWGVATQGASTSGYAFTGREWDAEIGLYYFRLRFYSPASGRFLSDDPIGLDGGINLGRYVSNGPTGAIDPHGTNTWVVNAGRVGWWAGNAVGGPAGGVVGAAVTTGAAVTVGWFGPKVVDWGNSYFSKPPKEAYDQFGPKAPGKPGPETGFKDPKGGDRWSKAPGSEKKGWEDASGNVWVPTGPPQHPNSHGGSHWDVTDRHGNFLGSRYPGGFCRP